MLRVLLASLLSSLVLLPTVQAKQITVSGSTSVTRVMDVLAEKYNQAHPDDYIAVQGVDSTAGIILAMKGVADLGMSSRYLTEAEASDKVTIVPIAFDGLAVATNIANPVSSLTRDQLAKIYLGEITNWKEVGGHDQAIAVVTREASSGSRYSFESLLGLTKVVNDQSVSNINPKNLVVNSNGMMKTLINHNPQAIGFVSMGSIDKSIKAIKFDNVEPTQDNIATSSYKLSRPFLVVYQKDHLEARAKKFLDYVTSKEGQALIESYGYTPIKQ
ncbi:phosphate ABC transporter substrate-binding protein [Vibrio rumoiensis]|uniref:Phosphate-binding protein n=1 Tax=Vibrio rumoiensis 1S-45 TaxID=1188252 RepID=A0A1E5DZ73_9VIBR|nr:phosphate ABC transporter substrate-binding protein [Vibrio rumoiensis]OEF23150.1 phosphate ABC transporter substrate-binding protein [Vibrio rumoiensis 1S-45]